MKKTFYLLVLLVSSYITYAQPTPPEGTTWEVVPQLTDDFEGTELDNNKWYRELWNYGFPVQMLAENSGVTDGNLWIKATLADDHETNPRWFETSRVWSRTQIKFPMYTECRMRTAHISGYNTYWLNNGDANNRDEIDIVENNSKPSVTSQENTRPFTMYSQYFIVKNGVTERRHANFDNRNLSDENSAKGKKWNEEYQTVGLWWIDKNTVQFYINGEEAGRVTTTQDFVRNQNMIWDLWTIDEAWAGGIANKNDLLDDSANTMYVDWVKTWKLNDPTLSLEDDIELAEAIQVYPIPANEYVNVRLGKGVAKDANVQIFDRSGRLLINEELNFEVNQIELLNLVPGVYFMKIINGEYQDSRTIFID